MNREEVAKTFEEYKRVCASIGILEHKLNTYYTTAETLEKRLTKVLDIPEEVERPREIPRPPKKKKLKVADLEKEDEEEDEDTDEDVDSEGYEKMERV